MPGGAGILPIGWWGAFLLNFVVIDFLYYWQHRWFHRIRPLWKLHRCHHTARRVDIWVTSRNTLVMHFLFVYFLLNPEEEPEVVELAPEPEVMDIAQLSGVGPKYRSLLREAGITTINQVADSEPEALLKLLHDTNETAGITKRPPTMYNVESWIEAAKAQLL